MSRVARKNVARGIMSNGKGEGPLIDALGRMLVKPRGKEKPFEHPKGSAELRRLTSLAAPKFDHAAERRNASARAMTEHTKLWGEDFGNGPTADLLSQVSKCIKSQIQPSGEAAVS